MLNMKVKKFVSIFFTVFVLITVCAGNKCYAQLDDKNTRPKAKWLRDRGPFDPRPYDNTLLGAGLINEDYFNFKNQLWIKNGISFGGYISANVQWGSVGGPTHGISETLLLFTWEPVRTSKSAGRLVVGIAIDQTFGRPTTREFADNQRIVETPNDLDTDPDLNFTTLGLLHWEHEWRTSPNGGLGIRAGQLYGPSYFGPARYLDDDRRFFMARPLAAASGAQWVGNNDIGLGVIGVAWETPWYISLGCMDGKANRQYPDFESLMDGQMLYLVEVGYEYDVDGPNEAALRLTVSHLDVQGGGGPGQSFMISGDIHFWNQLSLAARWSKSFNRLTSDYKDNISLGILMVNPFGRTQDLAGLGGFLGQPGASNYKRESGFELFYKLQLTQAISLTPDLQYWYRKDDGTSGNVNTWVWGLRSEIEF